MKEINDECKGMEIEKIFLSKVAEHECVRGNVRVMEHLLDLSEWCGIRLFTWYRWLCEVWYGTLYD